METYENRLENFPVLADWFGKQTNSQTKMHSPAEGLVYQTCTALTKDDQGLIKTWESAITRFLSSFTDLTTEILELGMQLDRGQVHFDLISQLADQSGLMAFRFMSAWIALNLDQLDECINECEKVEVPSSSIAALHGQALLEAGRAEEAALTLEVCVKLNPKELYGWFQLVKAQFCIDEFDSAWESLEKCSKLAPQSSEVAFFKALVAMKTLENTDRLRAAWQAAKVHFKRNADYQQYFSYLICIGFALNEEGILKEIIAMADFDKLKLQADFLSEIPKILRELQVKKWHEVATMFLGEITEISEQGLAPPQAV
jgi:tetratricopeptide (TPR) repeat protein